MRYTFNNTNIGQSKRKLKNEYLPNGDCIPHRTLLECQPDYTIINSKLKVSFFFYFPGSLYEILVIEIIN